MSIQSDLLPLSHSWIGVRTWFLVFHLGDFVAPSHAAMLAGLKASTVGLCLDLSSYTCCIIWAQEIFILSRWIMETLCKGFWEFWDHVYTSCLEWFNSNCFSSKILAQFWFSQELCEEKHIWVTFAHVPSDMLLFLYLSIFNSVFLLSCIKTAH